MNVPSKLSNRNISNSQPVPEAPADGGRMIVLTAPLTEAIDHAGYFIQMAMASLPIRMEGVINRKYPKWREVEHNEDGSARYMPAGVRLVEKSLLHACRRRFDAQSAGRDFRGRCLHIDLRLVEDADQLALLAATLRADQIEPLS